MIKVLQDWNEIGEAVRFLRKNRLPGHATPEKHWDLKLLHDTVAHIGRNSPVIDLGCSGLYGLRLLYAMGFRNLYGVDLNISARDRRSQIGLMWQHRSLELPFRLHQGDISKRMPYSDSFFDFAVCVSVVEHGVSLPSFFAELRRICKDGSVLLLTTDFWETELDWEDSVRMFDLPWQPFDRSRIQGLIETAADTGFDLLKPVAVPHCAQPVVSWLGFDFTFIAVTFRLSKRQ